MIESQKQDETILIFIS